jgi:hypothetical protein
MARVLVGVKRVIDYAVKVRVLWINNIPRTLNKYCVVVFVVVVGGDKCRIAEVRKKNVTL